MSEAKLHFVVLVNQLLTMLANMRLPPGVTSIDSLTRVRAAPPPPPQYILGPLRINSCASARRVTELYGSGLG